MDKSETDPRVQLANYCHRNGLAPPSYTDRCHRRQFGTVYTYTIVLSDGLQYTSLYESMNMEISMKQAAFLFLKVLLKQEQRDKQPTEAELERAKNDLQEYCQKIIPTKDNIPLYSYILHTEKDNSPSFSCMIDLPNIGKYPYIDKRYPSKKEASKHAAYECLGSLKKTYPRIVPPTSSSEEIPLVVPSIGTENLPFHRSPPKDLHIIFIDEYPSAHKLLDDVEILEMKGYVNFICEEEYKLYPECNLIKYNPDIDLSLFFAVLYPSLTNDQNFGQIIVFTDDLETIGQIEKLKRHIRFISEDNPTLIPFNKIEDKNKLFQDLKIEPLSAIRPHFYG